MGHLWANRFYSSPPDDEYGWAAIRYVERNPARAHALGLSDPLLAPDAPPTLLLLPDLSYSGGYTATTTKRSALVFMRWKGFSSLSPNNA